MKPLSEEKKAEVRSLHKQGYKYRTRRTDK